MRAGTGDHQLTYAIGDAHGRLDLLQDIVERCQVDAAQRGCEEPLHVFLGDTIDRGPDSAGVIAFLRKYSVEHQVVALRGNHDQMMADAVLGRDDGTNWAINGMAPTARSYGHGDLLAQEIPADRKLAMIVEALRSDQQAVEDARWLASLPLIHQDDHRIYVHAGLRPGVPLAEQSIDDLLWIRGRFLRHRGSFGKLVVHGHTPTDDGKPEVRSNRVGLDTGACWTGVLTAAVFDRTQAQPVAFLQTRDQR